MSGVGLAVGLGVLTILGVVLNFILTSSAQKRVNMIIHEINTIREDLFAMRWQSSKQLFGTSEDSSADGKEATE